MENHGIVATASEVPPTVQGRSVTRKPPGVAGPGPPPREAICVARAQLDIPHVQAAKAWVEPASEAVITAVQGGSLLGCESD